MRRLLVHPAQKTLLLIPLLAWPVVASLITYQDHWGPLGFLGSAFTNQRHGFGCRWRTSDAIDYYLASDGSLSLYARGSIHWEPENPNDNEVLVASLISMYPPTRGYGLVLQCVHYTRRDQYLEWVLPQDSVDINKQILSDSFDTHAALLSSNDTPEDVFVSMYDRGLDYAYAFRRGGPFEYRVRRFDTNRVYLAAELAYLLLLAWWLLTLIYARKLWPKYDGSHCPTCKYPTLNLPTTTCPECGTALPSPREP
ncbi:MAG: hypothetical protein Phyf2KO_27530 [Phycisphaerales bacterium]